MPTYIKKKIWICLTILALAVCCAIFVHLVYNGKVLLNNPSKSRYPITGVDLSHYQGTVDWSVLSQQDIRFAYIKATEGSSHVDDCFAYNWEESGKTNLKVGAYHFFSFDSPGATQAANFMERVGKRDGMLAPAIDVEYYADKKVNPPEPQVVREELQLMLDEIQEHYQMVPVIYSTEEVWETYLNGYFDEYPLWIRNVVTKPNVSKEWTYWQYSNRGVLDGHTGSEKYIDLNVFYGSEEEWNNILEIKVQPVVKYTG